MKNRFMTKLEKRKKAERLEFKAYVVKNNRNLIRQLRRRGLATLAVANELGISVATLRKWERDMKKPIGG